MRFYERPWFGRSVQAVLVAIAVATVIAVGASIAHNPAPLRLLAYWALMTGGLGCAVYIGSDAGSGQLAGCYAVPMVLLLGAGIPLSILEWREPALPLLAAGLVVIYLGDVASDKWLGPRKSHVDTIRRRLTLATWSVWLLAAIGLLVRYYLHGPSTR